MGTQLARAAPQFAPYRSDGPNADRPVVQCEICNLVQYYTRTGNCRRCLRTLPNPYPDESKLLHLLCPPRPASPEPTIDPIQSPPARIERIGAHIRECREARGLSQTGLCARSKVSRAYLSKIEMEQMTPSLGTLEKLCEGLGIGLQKFFRPPVDEREALLLDPFVNEVRPFLRKLAFKQWKCIKASLDAITQSAPQRPL